MLVRRVMVSAIILTCLTVIAIFTVDGPLAVWLQPVAAANEALTRPFIHALEFVFGFAISKFATGFAIVAVSLLMFAIRRWRDRAWLVLFVGVTHLTTRLVAGILKNVFERPRPFEALAGGSWQDRFFVDGGSSFPSGHAAHFWALFFALVFVSPKLRVPALLLAALVSIARIAVNDHYVSDVCASAAIAALVSCAYAVLLLRRDRGRA